MIENKWQVRFDDGMLGVVESKDHIQFICRSSQDTVIVSSDTVSVEDEHVGILDILQDGMKIIDVEADALWEW